MTGWLCPGCGRGYSPFVTVCGFCPGVTTIATGSVNPCPGCYKTPCNGSSTGCPPPSSPGITS